MSASLLQYYCASALLFFSFMKPSLLPSTFFFIPPQILSRLGSPFFLLHEALPLSLHLFFIPPQIFSILGSPFFSSSCCPPSFPAPFFKEELNSYLISIFRFHIFPFQSSLLKYSFSFFFFFPPCSPLSFPPPF